MARKNWQKTSMPEQVVMMKNVRGKMRNYETVLPLTKEQVTDIENLCDAFIAAFDSTESCRQTMIAMTNWRDAVFYGEPKGAEAPAAPAFAPAQPATYTLGVMTQFVAYRELIVASPGYTDAIGEDLSIVGAEILPKPPADVTPVFKSVTTQGYTVNVSGSMQGMDAMRVEYKRKGGNWENIAFLTNTPGGFQISPASPGAAETGHIRAVFIKKNAEFGNYSPDYPVTVA